MAKLVADRTSWTKFQQLRQAISDTDRKNVSAELAARYYEPVRRFVRAICRPLDADDVTNAFFEQKVFKTNGVFEQACARKGQFRGFLATSVRNFVTDERRRQKPDLLVDHPDSHPNGWASIPIAASDDRLLFKYWLRALVDEALSKTEAICHEKGQQRNFQLFTAVCRDGSSWNTVGKPLGIDGKTARSWAQTARVRFIEVLRELIAADPACDRGVDVEMREIVGWVMQERGIRHRGRSAQTVAADSGGLADDVTVSQAEFQIEALLAITLKKPPKGTDAGARATEAARALTQLGARLGVPLDGALDRATAQTVSLAQIEELNKLAKTGLERAQDASEQAATQLLYKASIAAAFVGYGKNISSVAIEKRRNNFRELTAIFADHPIGELFRQVDAKLGSS